MLSGFLFDLHNVPTGIQKVASILPATYVELARMSFLAGDNLNLIVRDWTILVVVCRAHHGRASTNQEDIGPMMTLLESITGSLRRISFLFRKEVLAILKDPAIRVILIVPIVIQSLVFGYAATYDLQSCAIRRSK